MITLRLTVTLTSPLHVGGETRLNTSATRPMLKNSAGFPYVPATTMKGRLRHEVERFLRGLYPDTICHAPVPEQMCQFPEGVLPCRVCRIFGSPWYESPLRFTDLQLSDDQIQLFERGQPEKGQRGNDKLRAALPRTETRYGVSINRKRRTAANERLFDTEILAPGLPLAFGGEAYFSGTLVELAPVLLAARAVNTLGSGRSRGYGWCTLDISGTEIEDVELSRLWQEWQQL